MNRCKNYLAFAFCLQIGLFNAALASAPDYLTAGINEYYKGHYTLARAQLEEAVARDPKNQKAHYFLALTLSQLHDNKAAIDSYQKCHSLNPGSECGIKAKKGLEYHQAAQSNNIQRTYKAIHKDRVNTSVDRIETQIEKELRESEEANEKLAKKKMEEVEKETQRIKEQAEQEINSLPRLRRNGYWRAQMRQQIQEQSKQRIEDLKKRVKEQVDQLDKDIAFRKESMQNMAEGLHGGLNSKKTKGTSLRPEGTSVHVRNYDHK